MKLAENIMHFARVLREAGLPVGPDRVLDALRALEVTGVQRRDDFYWTLAAIFLGRREQFEVFNQAFHIFWRDPAMLRQVMTWSRVGPEPDSPAYEPAMNRVAQAMMPARPDSAPDQNPTTEPEADRSFTQSDRERLHRADFATMTAGELAAAKKMIAHLRLPIPEISTRRMTADRHGKYVDLRATLRASLRGNTDFIPLRYRTVKREHPPLVVLCDISGSMANYSRMLLHFLHALTNDRDRVQTFLFGTRLTNITRQLRHRDVDVALDKVSHAVEDWSGGTRIAECIHEFNLHWSRRVLAQNAVVLLISDGLDRDGGAGLAQAMERLHKSCRKLIWLNPLLRFDRFEPRAAGIRAMLPHVDAFVPAHNIESLTALGEVLSVQAREPTTEALRDGHQRRAVDPGRTAASMGSAQRPGRAEGLHSRMSEHREAIE